VTSVMAWRKSRRGSMTSGSAHARYNDALMTAQLSTPDNLSSQQQNRHQAASLYQQTYGDINIAPLRLLRARHHGRLNVISGARNNSVSNRSVTWWLGVANRHDGRRAMAQDAQTSRSHKRQDNIGNMRGNRVWHRHCAGKRGARQHRRAMAAVAWRNGRNAMMAANRHRSWHVG